MTNKTKVFLIHSGNQHYLKECLLQAAMLHKTYLIGDNDRLEKICYSYHKDDKSLDRFSEFKNSYKHMSANPIAFELQCFKRFFLMQRVAEEKQLDHFWMIDSDLLLVENLSELTNFLIENKYDCSLSIQENKNPFGWSASPHISFWTRKSLSEFINFCIYTYTIDPQLLIEKYNYHTANAIPGGICDMTLLFLWSKDREGTHNNAKYDRKINLLLDHNINESKNHGSDQFSFNRVLSIKNIFFHENKYYCEDVVSKQNVPVACLHFQGSAKKYISNFRKVKNTMNLRDYAYLIPEIILEKIARKFLKRLLTKIRLLTLPKLNQ